MSKSMILGIDHGYAAMKTAHCCFPAGLVEYEHEPYSVEKVLEYEGRYFVVGTGRQPLQKDKTDSENYYLLTLAAIAMELEYRQAPPNAEIILAAGLPLTSFGRDKNAFRKYLLKNGEPVSFRYEGKPYAITISDVQLFPQGYAAVLTQRELLEEPSVIVADIGGWTVDLMRIDNRIPNAAACRSLELGVIRCLDEISEKIRRSLGLSMTSAQIESALRGEVNSLPEQAKEIIQAEAEKYVSKLLAAIQESGLDYRAMPASSQAPYPSLPAKAESSVISLLLLTKSNPLRWASIWLPKRGPRRNPAERFRWGEEEQGSVRGATVGRSETKRTLRRRERLCGRMSGRVENG